MYGPGLLEEMAHVAEQEHMLQRLEVAAYSQLGIHPRRGLVARAIGGIGRRAQHRRDAVATCPGSAGCVTQA